MTIPYREIRPGLENEFVALCPFLAVSVSLWGRRYEKNIPELSFRDTLSCCSVRLSQTAIMVINYIELDFFWSKSGCCKLARNLSQTFNLNLEDKILICIIWFQFIVVYVLKCKTILSFIIFCI